MLLNIFIFIDAAGIFFLSVTYLMLTLSEEGLMLNKKQQENGKRALVVAIVVYAFFLFLLFSYKAYRNKRALYTNYFMPRRNVPQYVQLYGTNLSTVDEIEQYELRKM